MKDLVTNHIEQHGGCLKVGVLLGILDLDCAQYHSSTLNLNRRRVDSSQLELLHVTHTPC